MTSGSTQTSNNVYEQIADFIDQEITEKDTDFKNIKGVRSALIDTITLSSDEERREEICKKIIAELNKKKEDRKNEMKEIRKNGDIVPDSLTNELKNLERLIADIEYRMNHGTTDTHDKNRNAYLDLNKPIVTTNPTENNDSSFYKKKETKYHSFDKTVIKSIVDEILNSNGKLENNDILLSLLSSNKYYEELCSELNKRFKKDEENEKIEEILKKLEILHNANKGETLEKVLTNAHINGIDIIRLKEMNLIQERLNNLKPGDRIKLNDGSVITVIKTSFGNNITFKESYEYDARETTKITVDFDKFASRNGIDMHFNNLGSGNTIKLKDGSTIKIIDISSEDGVNKITYVQKKGQEITENFNDFKKYRCNPSDITEIIINTKPQKTQEEKIKRIHSAQQEKETTEKKKREEEKLLIPNVNKLITELPDNITLQDKDKIRQARKAYSNLSPRGRRQIDPTKLLLAEDTLRKLEEARDEELIHKNEIITPEPEPTPTPTDAEPTPTPEPEPTPTPTDAEPTPTPEPEPTPTPTEEGENYSENVKKLLDLINKIPPIDEITLAHEELINEARRIHSKDLSSQEQRLVKSVRHLVNAQGRLGIIKDFIKLLDGLPDDPKDITNEHRNTINKITEYYKKFSEKQIASLPGGGHYVNKFNDCIAALKNLDNPVLENLDNPVKKVQDLIDGLNFSPIDPEKHEEAIITAKVMYNRLSDEEKEKVNIQNLEDYEQALDVTKSIDRLVGFIYSDTESNAVEEAREKYNKLSDKGKQLLDSSRYVKFTKLTEALEIYRLINELPKNIEDTKNTELLSYEKVIKEAREKYNKLSEEEKEMLRYVLQDKLTKAKEKLDKLLAEKREKEKEKAGDALKKLIEIYNGKDNKLRQFWNKTKRFFRGMEMDLSKEEEKCFGIVKGYIDEYNIEMHSLWDELGKNFKIEPTDLEIVFKELKSKGVYNENGMVIAQEQKVADGSSL